MVPMALTPTSKWLRLQPSTPSPPGFPDHVARERGGQGLWGASAGLERPFCCPAISCAGRGASTSPGLRPCGGKGTFGVRRALVFVANQCVARLTVGKRVRLRVGLGVPPPRILRPAIALVSSPRAVLTGLLLAFPLAHRSVPRRLLRLQQPPLPLLDRGQHLFGRPQSPQRRGDGGEVALLLLLLSRAVFREAASPPAALQMKSRLNLISWKCGRGRAQQNQRKGHFRQGKRSSPAGAGRACRSPSTLPGVIPGKLNDIFSA